MVGEGFEWLFRLARRVIDSAPSFGILADVAGTYSIQVYRSGVNQSETPLCTVQSARIPSS